MARMYRRALEVVSLEVIAVMVVEWKMMDYGMGRVGVRADEVLCVVVFARD